MNRYKGLEKSKRGYMSNLEALKNRDYVLVIDRSGSMSATDTPSGKTRFKECEESTLAIASKLNELDPDGITLIAFGSAFKKYENTTPEKVANVFKENEPMGSTNLSPVLKDVFSDYNKRKSAGNTKANGEMLIIVTDGQPNDESEVMKEIVKFGNTLGNADEEYGISFIQIGRDQEATNFLKRLDDDLVSKHGAKHDIVDAKSFTEMETLGLTETLIAALND